MKKILIAFAIVAATIGIASVSASTPVQPLCSPNQMLSSSLCFNFTPGGMAPSPIRHIVYIMQENRTFENLFHGFPGATTATQACWPAGIPQPNFFCYAIQPMPISQNPVGSPPAAYDLGHTFGDFGVEDSVAGEFVAACKDGTAPGGCLGTCPTATPISTPNPPQPTPIPSPIGGSNWSECAITYVPEASINQYWEIAENYAIADENYQTARGPTFPSHLYAVGAGSPISQGSQTYFKDNIAGGGGPNAPNGPTGCDVPPGTAGGTIFIFTGGTGPKTFPCTNMTTLLDELVAAGLLPRYYTYQENPPYYYSFRQSGVDAISRFGCTYQPSGPICPGPGNQPLYYSAPPSNVLADIASCNLPTFAWVMPTTLTSDHPSNADGSGPAWVASVVNAIGNSMCDGSSYWNDTAIFITWDDWGGFYDSAFPATFNHFEDGFRTPLLIAGGFVRPGYVSHVVHESSGSVLKFAEETFNLPSLGRSDARSDDLMDCFNFAAPPIPFVNIAFQGEKKMTVAYWRKKMAHDTMAPDY
jgi:hypothetical protein